PQLWLTFEARSGQEVFLQLGVPAIERLQDFRPALALLGPSLPAVDLPFTVPEGLGGIVLAPGAEVEPEFFHEPFTGTDSWILGEIQTVLSESGRYYAVAYVPNGQTGKLWVAPGRQEVFGLADIFSLPTIINQVREFHEVPAAGIPCFLPLLAIMFLSWGGLRLVKIKRNRIPRCR
ncbi:MAG: hypothetical protein JSV03_12870, partial [Planctomycetota bacterium]